MKTSRWVKCILAAVVLSSGSSSVLAQNNIFKVPTSFQTMSQRWELDSSTRRGTFIITPYKPVFVTAGRYSNHPNTQPTSENPSYTLPFKVNYNNYESKFQLSFKPKYFRGCSREKRISG